MSKLLLSIDQNSADREPPIIDQNNGTYKTVKKTDIEDPSQNYSNDE